MVGNTSTNTPSAANIKRIVAQAMAAERSKNNGRKAKQNSGGSGGSSVAPGTTSFNRGRTSTGLANGAVRIANSEFVTDLSAGGSIQSWDMNPNSSTLFTWLGRVANGYEMFRFTKLEFVYTPVCSSSTTGMVVMAPDYDASDNAPATKQSLSAYAGSVRGNVWNKQTCKITPPQGWYFVGNSVGTINPNGTDIKFYDIAKFYLGIFNSSTSGPVGELSVNYVCEFAKPDYGPPPSPGEYVSVPSPTVSNPAGTTSALVMSGNLPVSITNPSAGALGITFPTAGTFIVMVRTNATQNVSGPPWGSGLQSDPGATATTSIPFTDYVTNWGSASAAAASIVYYVVSALAGTTFTIVLYTGVSAVNFVTLHISGYNKIAYGTSG